MSNCIVRGGTDREFRLGGDLEDWGRVACAQAWRDIGLVCGDQAMAIHGTGGGVPSEGPVLFAGPWIGEFGWELARWQGGVRRLSAVRRTDAHLVVMGDAGHDVLYERADEYWEMPDFWVQAGFTRQCTNVRGEPGRVRQHLRALAFAIWQELGPARSAVSLVAPRRFRPDEQVHVRLGHTEEPNGTVVYMPRHRRWHAWRNWPAQRWDDLELALHRATGLRAVWVDEVWPLRESIQALRRARFAVCPESGGIFLALLCGTPTVAFGRERWRRRVCDDENFLHTPVRYVGRPDNNHSPREVADATLDFLRTL